ncbi:hypothetical protein C8046_07915 [Serinibacter arcticus]|uniref:DUF559 domain-containing protein n=1 Tax=Serinibacter arcticus TaxID=1655435 RepID=A0A2U1ZUD7_9MICO|nr:hypothetical protein C8046_07915 [Serinibacter arcticus]
MRQLGILSVAQLRDHGVTRSTVRNRVEKRRWRSVARGVVDVGAVPPDQLHPAERLTRSAVLGLVARGPDAIAVGLSALALFGVWGVPLNTPPQVTKPDASGRKKRAEVVCRRFVPGDSITHVNGFRVVTADRALAQAIVEVDARTALGLLDSALHRGVIDVGDLERVSSLASRRRGARKIWDVWRLVDGRRESPLESWAYYDLVAAGLTPTDIQVTFRDSFGRVLARADIGFKLPDGSWLLIELDGREYHPPGLAGVEESRDNTLSIDAFGTTLRYRGHHLGPRGQMIREVRRALEARHWVPARAAAA